MALEEDESHYGVVVVVVLEEAMEVVLVGVRG